MKFRTMNQTYHFDVIAKREGSRIEDGSSAGTEIDDLLQDAGVVLEGVALLLGKLRDVESGKSGSNFRNDMI